MLLGAILLFANSFSYGSEPKQRSGSLSEWVYDQRRPEDMIFLVENIANFKPGATLHLMGSEGECDMPAEILKEALRKSPDLMKVMLASNNPS